MFQENVPAIPPTNKALTPQEALQMIKYFPLLKSAAFAEEAKVETARQNQTLEQLVASGKAQCIKWNIKCMHPLYPNINVWDKLLNDQNQNEQSPQYYLDIQNNLNVIMDYLEDARISLETRKTDLRELVSALGACGGGTYDRIESLATSKKQRTTCVEILAAFRLQLVEGIVIEANRYYSNTAHKVYQGYATHMRIYFKKRAAENGFNLHLPATSNIDALDDEYHQNNMRHWFFTLDKEHPEVFFRSKFSGYYVPLTIVDYFVKDIIIQAAENTFLDEVQLSVSPPTLLENDVTGKRTFFVYYDSIRLKYTVQIKNQLCTYELSLRDLSRSLYDSILIKTIGRQADDTRILADDENRAILAIALKNQHTSHLKQFDLSADSDYTRFTLFQNKCRGLPLIVEKSDQWGLFYNEENASNEASATGYTLKNISELRISVMRFLGDSLFKTMTLKKNNVQYILLPGCPELCYRINESNEAQALLDYPHPEGLLHVATFKQLQEWKLTALVPLTPPIFQDLVENQGVIIFSGAHLKDIDFTIAPFFEYSLGDFGFFEPSVTFTNVTFNQMQWRTLFQQGRSDFSGAECLTLTHSFLQKIHEKDHAAVLASLHKNETDIHVFRNGLSTLWSAIYHLQSIEIVNIMLARDIDDNSLQHSALMILSQPRIHDFYEMVFDKIVNHKNFKNTQLNLSRDPKTQNTALHLATINEHTDMIALLCTNGSDILAMNKEGKSPLDLAAEKENLDIVEILLRLSPKIKDVRQDIKNTLLLKAIRAQNSTLAILLLENGADVNYCEGRIPTLWLAIQNVTAYNRMSEVVHYMLSDKCKIQKTYLSDTVLFILQKPQLTLFLKTTLEKILAYPSSTPIDLNTGWLPDLQNRNPQNRALHLAVINGHKDFIPLLCQKGASFLTPNKAGKSPLDLAIEKENLDSDLVTDLLLFSPPKNGTAHQSSLELAAEKGRLDLVEVMLKYSDRHKKLTADKTNTLLSLAINAKNSPLALLLLQISDSYHYDSHNAPILWSAIQNNLHDIIDAILARKVDEMSLNICILRILSETPPLSESYKLAFQKILKHPLMDIHKIQKEGMSILDWMIKNNRLDLSEILLQHMSLLPDNSNAIEISINKLDTSGKNSWLSLAIQHQYNQLTLILLANGADILALNAEGKSPVDVAIENNNIAQVNILLQSRSALSPKVLTKLMTCKNTWLLQAAQAKNDALMTCLLQHRSNILFKNNEGQSSLTWAIDNKQEETITFLITHASTDSFNENELFSQLSDLITQRFNQTNADFMIKVINELANQFIFPKIVDPIERNSTAKSVNASLEYLKTACHSHLKSMGFQATQQYLCDTLCKPISQKNYTQEALDFLQGKNNYKNFRASRTGAHSRITFFRNAFFPHYSKVSNNILLKNVKNMTHEELKAFELIENYRKTHPEIPAEFNGFAQKILFIYVNYEGNNPRHRQAMRDMLQCVQNEYAQCESNNSEPNLNRLITKITEINTDVKKDHAKSTCVIFSSNNNPLSRNIQQVLDSVINNVQMAAGNKARGLLVGSQENANSNEISLKGIPTRVEKELQGLLAGVQANANCRNGI